MTTASIIGVNHSAATVVRWLTSRNIKMSPMISGQSVSVHSQSEVSTKRLALCSATARSIIELARLDRLGSAVHAGPDVVEVSRQAGGRVVARVGVVAEHQEPWRQPLQPLERLFEAVAPLLIGVRVVPRAGDDHQIGMLVGDELHGLVAPDRARAGQRRRRDRHRRRGHPPLARTISSRPLRSATACSGGNHWAACESPSSTILIDDDVLP